MYACHSKLDTLEVLCRFIAHAIFKAAYVTF